MGNPGHCCGATTWVTRLAVIVAQHGFKLMRLTYISSDRRIESMQCFTFPILEVLFFCFMFSGDPSHSDPRELL